MILCGNCHQRHEGVDAVRACFAGAVFTTPNGATPRQLELIETLCRERNLPIPTDLTKSAASAAIDKLIATPKPAAVRAIGNSFTQASAPGGEAISIPQRTFTLVRRDGSYRTLQITRAKWADDKLVASFLSGPDNDRSYTPFAFIREDGKVFSFKKFAANVELRQDLEDLLTLTTADRDAAHEEFLRQAETYAMESGNCMRCCRTLTVPASISRGLGPQCAGIEGVA